MHDTLDEPLSSDDGKLARTIDEAERLLATAEPGDTIRIRNGDYTDWGELEIDCYGKPGRPITIAAETQHGVTFRGDVCFRVRGRYVTIQGFDFRHVNGRGSRFRWAIIHLAAEHTRVTSCRFLSCCYADAEREEEMGCKYAIQSECSNTRVDHCYFHDRQGTSINYCHTPEMVENDVVGYYLVDHNIFRDSSEIAKRKNNREAISIWGGNPAQAVVFMRLCAEHNIFDNESGDGNGGEIMTVKASGTVWRHNVFANGPCGFSFRTGRSSTAYGNVLINCRFEEAFPHRAHAIHGAYHLFVNNYCIGNTNAGMALPMGDVTMLIPHERSETTLLNCETVRDGVFAHNAFLHNAPLGLGIHGYGWSKPRDQAQFPPHGNTIVNNLFVQDRGMMLDFKGLGGNTVHHNLFHTTGSAEIGNGGSDPVVADPLLTDDPLPRLRKNSPARGAGFPSDALPEGFYGGRAEDDVDIGPIDYGPYGFDYERIPHIPPSKQHLQAKPLRAMAKALPKRQTAGRPVVLDGDISAGRVTKYVWDFGDGSTYEGTRGVAIHVFDKAGRYHVGLTVIGPSGGQSKHLLPVEITSSNASRNRTRP